MPANDSRDGNPVVAEPAATERAIHSEAPAAVAAALLDWQRTGDSDRFEQLVAAVRPKAEIVVTSVLKRRGIRDPLAIDEAVALVLDHLRRLSRWVTNRADVGWIVRRVGRDRPVHGAFRCSNSPGTSSCR
ncbi:MAG: hypothetical protein ACKOTB_03775, partial [Planctomycetia bacterium]